MLPRKALKSLPEDFKLESCTRQGDSDQSGCRARGQAGDAGNTAFGNHEDRLFLRLWPKVGGGVSVGVGKSHREAKDKLSNYNTIFNKECTVQD